jgi:hypothetical protein
MSYSIPNTELVLDPSGNQTITTAGNNPAGALTVTTQPGSDINGAANSSLTTAGLLITTGSATGYARGGGITLTTGNGHNPVGGSMILTTISNPSIGGASAIPGNLTLTCGDYTSGPSAGDTTSGGTLTLTSGSTAGAGTTNGGSITLTTGNSGSGPVNGGGITLTTGSTTGSNTGGSITLSTSASSNPVTGGSITLTTGAGTGVKNGGGITLTTGANGGATGVPTGGSILLTSGSGGSVVPVGGNITLTSGSTNFGSTGGSITVTSGGGNGVNQAGGLTLTAGSGGSSFASIGGSILLTSGSSNSGSFSHSTGGSLTLTSGNNGTTGIAAGGSITLTSGSTSGGTESGGNITLTCNTPANGGSIVLFGTGANGTTGSPAHGNIYANYGNFSNLVLTTPLPLSSGGTGTASPALVAGSGISLSGSFPNQTVTNTAQGSPTNLLVNGSFERWSNGTSFGFSDTASHEVADGWYVVQTASAPISYSIAQNTSNFDTGQSSLAWTVFAMAGYLYQPIANWQDYAGQTVYFSCKVKGSGTGFSNGLGCGIWDGVTFTPGNALSSPAGFTTSSGSVGVSSNATCLWFVLSGNINNGQSGNLALGSLTEENTTSPFINYWDSCTLTVGSALPSYQASTNRTDDVTSNDLGSKQSLGSLQVSQLSTPSTPTVTPTGTTGSTTYTYKIVARLLDGTTTAASAAGTTTTGNASLTFSHYNSITWSAVLGAVSYDVYRTVGGASQGKIANVGQLFLNDGAAGNGIYVGDSTTAPTVNSTGSITVTSLNGSGALSAHLSTTTAASYTILSTDYTVTANATSNVVAITLPLASAQSGRILNVKKTDSSVNAVTVNRSGSDLIDGQTSVSLGTQYQSITIQSDGTNWNIL